MLVYPDLAVILVVFLEFLFRVFPALLGRQAVLFQGARVQEAFLQVRLVRYAFS